MLEQSPKHYDLKSRLQRIGYEWPLGSTLIFEIVMFLVGVVFLTQPIHRSIPPTSPWFRWGGSGLTIIGIAFVILGAYGALYRERQSGLIPTFFFVTLGLIQSFHPLNLVGVMFYLPFLAGGIADAYRRYQWKHLREARSYLIYVPKPTEGEGGDAGT